MPEHFKEINKKNNFTPNLIDYDTIRADFNWFKDAFEHMDWLPSGGLNNAYECIDRHVNKGNGDRTAMIWLGKNSEHETYSYTQFKELTDRFGSAMRNLDIKKGDRIFLFLDRIPELYIASFGTLKVGGIIVPLFSAFGPQPVKDRMQDAGARFLITSPSLYKKIKPILSSIETLEKIVIVNKNNRDTYIPEKNTVSYEYLMQNASSENFVIEDTHQYDFAVMHYTSGSTGKPKGVLHRHQAIVQQWLTGKWALDLKPQDIYWCTADPGWVTGTSYGMLAPWANGVTQVIYEGGFSANRWYDVIDQINVTVWYTAPTAIRLLMRAGDEPIKSHSFKSLRFIASVGEPLNPEAVVWGNDKFGMPIHDNWWQTETGAIMCANYPTLPVRPGSMGMPMPGIEMAALDSNYKPLPANKVGLLGVRPGWPSMMYTYFGQVERYNTRFKRGWYITGDEAYMDNDGYFWFHGRSDDVINTAGHLVGPFEVESALIEHPAVAEAGVIGKPDPIAMEVVKAFVTLSQNYQPTPELKREILQFAREKLAAGTAPREIDFIDTLPKTRSGKIMRRLLKARELGLPEGDISTLED